MDEKDVYSVVLAKFANFESNKEEKYKAFSILLSIALIFSLRNHLGKAEGTICEPSILNDNRDSHFLIVFRSILGIFIIWLFRKSFFFFEREYELYHDTRMKIKSDSFTKMEYLLSRVDYLYSHNDNFKPISLFVVTIVLISVGGLLWRIFADTSLEESLWAAWTFVADPGTHASQQAVSNRFLSLFITLGGLVVFALIIGVISDSVGSAVESLRQGRSRVIVSNHTLILGQVSILSYPCLINICLDTPPLVLNRVTCLSRLYSRSHWPMRVCMEEPL
jgi:hypothetical protein